MTGTENGENDIKYLKLWLLYASYVEKPTIIYKFLIANDIGTDFLFYMKSMQQFLERDGRLAFGLSVSGVHKTNYF